VNACRAVCHVTEGLTLLHDQGGQAVRPAGVGPPTPPLRCTPRTARITPHALTALAWTSCALDARLVHGRQLAHTHAVREFARMQSTWPAPSLSAPQLLAPRRAGPPDAARAPRQPSERLRAWRGSRWGVGEERVPACAGEERLGCRARPLRPFRCERGIRGGSVRSRRTHAQRQMDLN
jgi:hypothetical protein